MKKLMLGFVLATLVSAGIRAQTETSNPKPPAPAVQSASTVNPGAPKVQPSPAAVQPAATVQPAPAVQPAATVQPAPKPVPPPPVTPQVKPQPAPSPQSWPSQPAVKQPEKGKENKPKSGKKAEGPLEWGTDYWHGTVRANWWDADYSSKFKFVSDVAGVPLGETLDMKKMLNLTTPSSVWEIEVWGRPSKHNRLFGSYMFSEYSGKVNALDQKIVEGGKTFDVNVDVRTKLTNNRATLNYQWMPWANKHGGIGPFIGVEYYQYSLEMKSNVEDQKFTQTLNLPVPVLGLEGDYLFGFGLGIWGKAAGIGGGFSDLHASYYDFEAGLEFKWKLLMAGIGYRWLEYDIQVGKDNKDNFFKVNTAQTGVLATVGINF